MLEFLLAATAQTAPTLPADAAATGPDTLRTVFDGILSVGLVAGAVKITRRAVMGYFLPEEMPDVNRNDLTTRADPRAVAIVIAAYLAGTVATTVGVYLLTRPAYAALWFGAVAFVGCAGALWSHRGQTPIDDVRLLAAARKARDGNE